MQLAKATLARLRRLHPFTWCMVLLVVAVMVLIVVPGMEADRDETAPWYANAQKQLYWDTAGKYQEQSRQASAGHRTTIWITDHGWPWPFLLRSLGSFDTVAPGGYTPSRTWSKPLIAYQTSATGTSTGAPMEVSWSNRDNWPLENESYRLHLGYLLLDLVVALVVVAVAAGLTEGWIRWRGGLLRFRILDLLIVITGSSIALAWSFHHLRISERENEVVQSMTTETWIRGGEKDYAGPKWMARLVGNPELLPFLYHYDHVHWLNNKSVQSFDEWQREFQAVRKLQCLRSITLPEGVPLELVAELVRKRRLESIGFEFQCADAAQFQPTETPAIEAHQLDLLQDLGIRHLELIGANVLASDIETAASLPATTRITLHDVSATLDDIEAIRERHPQVEILTTWGHYRTKEPASDSAQKRLAQHYEAARREAQAEAKRLASTVEAPPDDQDTTKLPELLEETQSTLGAQ